MKASVRVFALMAVLVLGVLASCGGDSGAPPESAPEAAATPGSEGSTEDAPIGDDDGGGAVSSSEALDVPETEEEIEEMLEDLEAELEEAGIDVEELASAGDSDGLAGAEEVSDSLPDGLSPNEAYAYFEGTEGYATVGPVSLEQGVWQISFGWSGNVGDDGEPVYLSVDADGPEFIERMIDTERESGGATYLLSIGLTDADMAPGDISFQVWGHPGPNGSYTSIPPEG